MDPEPGVPDGSAGEAEPTGAEPLEAAPVGDERTLLLIRMWSGFEPESITDAQLLAALGLDYPGVDIPNWVMTELGPLVVKGSVGIDEFKTALEYVLERS